MTQFEFDKEMRRINEAQSIASVEIKAKIRELNKVKAQYEAQSLAAKLRAKEVGHEIYELYQQLKEKNRAFHEQKHALNVAFPKAVGQRMEHNVGMTKHEAFGLRKKMIENLKEGFKDDPRVNVDGIDVHFTLDGESVSFEAIIPKTNGREEE